MKELISLNVGQAGIEVGAKCWKLFCKEHYVDNDGSACGQSDEILFGSRDCLFSETVDGKYSPRCIFADLEPYSYRCIHSTFPLLARDNLITWKEDSANNYIKGHYTIGRELMDPVLDKFRKIIENCDSPQGVLINHSIGGGTGSGFGSLLLERLYSNYEKLRILNFTVFPSPKISAGSTEDYNAVLAIPSLLEFSNASVIFQNEAIYNVYNNYLDSALCNYQDVNECIVQFINSYTSGFRCEGICKNQSLLELTEILVPSPRLKFLLPSYSPYIFRGQGKNYSVTKLSESLLDSKSFLCTADITKGKIFAYNAVFRGDLLASDCFSSFDYLRNRNILGLSEVDSTRGNCVQSFNKPHGFDGGNIGEMDRDASFACNSNSVNMILETIASKFDRLQDKRAFVHWYVGEGLSEGFFSEAREDLAALICQYLEN